MTKRRISVFRSTVPRIAALLGASVGLGCSGNVAGPRIPEGATLSVSTTGLARLDSARDGVYAVWLIDGFGMSHLGAVATSAAQLTLVAPVRDPVSVVLTLELPGATVTSPSGRTLLRGDFAAGRAELTVAGALTQGALPLRERPGQFTMFTPSDNDVRGYPSSEEAGAWLFNMKASATEQNDFYVRLTPLQSGWTYEGWMVRDLGLPDAIWLSYGKFLPDWTGALNQPDDTGWGPFSGVADYTTARLEDFPGDDWISNPLNLPFPATLTLPLNLREKNAAGASRWTHVITVEPASDKGEPIGGERPSFIRPYADAFGDLGPGVPRTITFHPDGVPRGRVEVR